MQECKLTKKVDLSLLANPTQGRIYLKDALDKGNEQDFLQALHEIIDSLLDSDDRNGEVLPLPVWKNAKVA